MTAFFRVASGSLATWSRLAITVGTQLVLVPVYLSFWSPDTYGVWLALQTFYALSTIIGLAHLTFLENEFFRIGNSNFRMLGWTLYSSIPIALSIAFVQLIIVVGLVKTHVFGLLLIPSNVTDQSLEADASWIALAQVACWMLINSISGLFVRLLCAIGHYARFDWWGFPYEILIAAIPVSVLVSGGGLLAVGLSQVAVTFLFNLVWLIDALRITKRESITFESYNIKLGIDALRKSMYVLLRLFMEMARQTGFRLAMLPVVGPTKLAEFSTQRTVGNTSLQCMRSVYAPLLPELMRYVRERKQRNMEGAFSILWTLLVLAICPLTVAIQTAMPLIFPWWTRHSFAFDGVLLCLLSACVLVNMISLPAIAICTGNNLVSIQFKIATIAAAVLFVLLIPLTHLFGIRGAAISILICEATPSALYINNCSLWLREAELAWPAKPFEICAVAVVLTFLVSLLIALWYEFLAVWLISYIVALALVASRLWKATPHETKLYLMERLRALRFARS
jgi:O-antigen/teichoic acid export membrane protein